MDSEIIDAVTGWDSAPTDRGYGGLRSLADDGFTGAVVAGMTWGFMLNGRLLGVFDGDIADFDGESFEAHRAPDSSLPLLYAMQETGGDIRAQYYTEETPLSDADGTLSAGGFTGYVELSENVLSGDYYIVYHGGKSMSAAFVGNSKRLITGDEALERATDEIGIYKVFDVDIDLVEIPDDGIDDSAASDDESTDVAAGAGSAAAAAGTEHDSDAPAEAEPDEPPTDDAVRDTSQTAERGGDATAASAEPATTETTGTTESADETDGSAPRGANETPSTAQGQSEDSSTTEASANSEHRTAETDAEPSTEASESGEDSPSAPATGASDADSTSKNGETAPDPLAEGGAPGDDVFSAEAEWRNARSIPSLDPRDAKGESVGDRPGTPRRGKQSTKQATRPRPPQKQESKQPKQRKRTSEQTSTEQGQPNAVDPKEANPVKEKLSALESERDRLESERDALRNERDEHRARAEELEDRVAELESEVDRLRAELEEAGIKSADRSMSPDEALRGTNLFVRYARKGEATLEKAHAGQASREEVVENLRLEHHTTFDTEGLGIEGQPYEEFLHETPEYGFAKWVVTDLLYEIGETDNRSSLAGVFDSIPKADRIELYGTVSVPIGEGETEPRQFDVIVRDQMGEPLFVANLNDSRDPATQPMVTQLIKDSKAVADAKETLGSAFVVTKSFFEPEALEAATAETGGGLLSRSKRKSFVKLSRKQGYHLCLVEARSGEFHLNVPDL
ncbi:hypothetical protein E6P09_08735 [Haloferax mediterranei ATCC 33500]|uniref:DUF7527 domain-containing protein n=1 Tax=Haloferax mediterranei (strain ATCC 33500 / DSM 1411 / JCM 8866 / NBRC 14739 / NCIMB 2177 / R-4) TaxID=523841 RepID=I3R3P9_HALMT|nr:hypothetical protein [Haloferax mediterranei]AFK18859.2 hypothetical protein HFX_1143 [Haloferax mediterranei ATCC 33500]AHZ21777.1 hypothetical protein BM92_03495 [Haloferax mediterranei ATCC 33500]EMA03283.1 hypothetical protein C439_04775 [Haloferax mediterranei ATCC 33500]MDX5988952.1 hypothetical protein [Haloferax mediterranei ATCC 33500]QCQ75346.1 hypothetical protein E6P09_08735 [Haloferax mediterranei ATCC 33500]